MFLQYTTCSYYHCFNEKKLGGGGPEVKYMSDILQDTLNLKEFIDIVTPIILYDI